MFDYKDAAFYTAYFRALSDFAVLEEFHQSDEPEDENLYVGSVEVLNTPHPLIVRVEIPLTFPHNKLMFRTSSLRGYPHLIHLGQKTRFGDWFCLNTPFAETAEEQLNQEVSRLKGWVRQYMRNDLPAFIDDPSFKRALAMANAYDWENPDEVDEYRVDSTFSFLGDFALFRSRFSENKGVFNCIKTRDNRYFVLNNPEFSSYRIPYIIVDEPLNDIGELKDFVSLKKRYGWDDTICQHLLPGFDLTDDWLFHALVYHYHNRRNNEEDVFALLSSVRTELEKAEPYLKVLDSSCRHNDRVRVLPKQNSILLKELDALEDRARNGCHFGLDEILSNTAPQTQEEYDQQVYYEEYYPYEYHGFVIGFCSVDTIKWYFIVTNHSLSKYESITFDFRVCGVELRRLEAQELLHVGAQIIRESSFFGRGMFSQEFRNKRIALVGLGAVGSVVAESLAKGGVNVSSLWDTDVVEPGNICRSIYEVSDIGESKVNALAKKIRAINPFAEKNAVVENGHWRTTFNDINIETYEDGSFYGNINYDDQEKCITKLHGFDLIIDCTGSNELLHFLSYAVPESSIVSMCITNHANELLCISSRDGNPFELRKAYLSRIEQDTKNFFLEGSGCYSPTFLATNADIASLVNLVVRELNKGFESGRLMHSMVLSHKDFGVLTDRLETYSLENGLINMVIPHETLLDAEDMSDVEDGPIGFILGYYSRNGDLIMVTHIVDTGSASEKLADAFKTSKGIIDYIGDFRYSGPATNTITEESFDIISTKASDDSINTNNPLLLVRNPDASLSFFLFINNRLVPFIKKED